MARAQQAKFNTNQARARASGFSKLARTLYISCAAAAAAAAATDAQIYVPTDVAIIDLIGRARWPRKSRLVANELRACLSVQLTVSPSDATTQFANGQCRVRASLARMMDARIVCKRACIMQRTQQSRPRARTHTDIKFVAVVATAASQLLITMLLAGSCRRNSTSNILSVREATNNKNQDNDRCALQILCAL